MKKRKKNHGRIEKRVYNGSNLLPEEVLSDWKGAKTAVKVNRCREINDKKSEEVVYALTSLDLEKYEMKEIANYLRNHWFIENKLHYVKDVTMGEDLSRIRKGNASQLFASLRNIVLNLFRLNGVENIAAEIRKMLYYPNKYTFYLNGFKLGEN